MDSPTTSGTELDVGDMCEMLVAGEEANALAGMASLSVARGASTGTMSLESRADGLAERCGDVVEIVFSSMAAGRVSNMLMEGVGTVEPEGTGRLAVWDSQGGTVEEFEGSVGAVFPVGSVGILAVGNSGPLALALGIEGLMLTSVSLVAAMVALVASVHISVSEGGTVLEGGFESGTEVEIVTTGGVVEIRV